MKRKVLLVFCFTAFCLSGTPAFADMFDFNANLAITFDGSTLNASLYSTWPLTLNRLDAPTGSALLGPTYLSTLGDLSLTMAVTNINDTTETADGTGTITLMDIDGDTITGSISGNWAMIGGYTTFTGDLTNVMWTTSDGLFNGDSGAVALDLLTSPPWDGQVVELIIEHPSPIWALSPTLQPWPHAKPGSIYAVVPTPAAILLGILGLSTVGIKLRKYA